MKEFLRKEKMLMENHKKKKLSIYLVYLFFFIGNLCVFANAFYNQNKLKKIDKIYTDTCTVKCVDYKMEETRRPDSDDKKCINFYFTYTGSYHGTEISFTSDDFLKFNGTKMDFEYELEHRRIIATNTMKKVKNRLGTTKILNVNPNNPEDYICKEEVASEFRSSLIFAIVLFVFLLGTFIIVKKSLRHPERNMRMDQRNSRPYANMSQEEKDQMDLQLMNQQIQQSRGIKKIFFIALRKMQKDNMEAEQRKHDHKWHIRFR